MLDLSFFYKFTGRHILFLKYSEKIYSYKQIIKLKNTIIYFNIKFGLDFDNLAITNYFYFFKYFFGIIPYYVNYKYEFSQNMNYYTYFLQYIAIKEKKYIFLFIYLNDIFFSINKKNRKQINHENFLELSITDMNFFIEKKNTLGFFSLNLPINLKLTFIKKMEIGTSNLITLFKLQY